MRFVNTATVGIRINLCGATIPSEVDLRAPVRPKGTGGTVRQGASSVMVMRLVLISCEILKSMATYHSVMVDDMQLQSRVWSTLFTTWSTEHWSSDEGR
jgi:hypothetical protein